MADPSGPHDDTSPAAGKPGDGIDGAGEGPTEVDRRSAIKHAGVGAGIVLGLVWTSPRIEGLSLRSEYARAASAPDPVLSDTHFGVEATDRSDPYELNASMPAVAYGYTTHDFGLENDGGARSFPIMDFLITRSSGCATTVDVAWNSALPAVMTASDATRDPAGRYDNSRQTRFHWTNPVAPSGFTIHFAC
jgi:hypothetical protein